MKKLLLSLILIILFVSSNGSIYNQYSQKTDSNSIIQVKPLIGLRIFNIFQSTSGNCFKGIISFAPQFGIDIQFRNSFEGVSIRKEFYYGFNPTIPDFDIEYKRDAWLIEYKHTLHKRKFFKGYQLGAGISFIEDQNFAEHVFNVNNRKIGSVAFISIPYEHLRFEFRTDTNWTLFIPWTKYSFCITYNFSH
jgi:hypothetical protein